MPEETSPVYISVEEYERIKPLLYHIVDSNTQLKMELLRTQVILLALQIMRNQDRSRSQSLALTELEYTSMRAIQGLALTGDPTLPPTFHLLEEPSNATIQD